MQTRFLYLPFCNTKRVWAVSICCVDHDGRVAIRTVREPLVYDVPETFNNIVKTRLGLVPDDVRVVAPITVASDTNEVLREGENSDFEKLRRYGEKLENALSVFDDLWAKGGRFVFRFERKNDTNREADRLETVIRILRSDRCEILGLDALRFSHVAQRRLIAIRWEMMSPKRIKQPKANFFQLANAAAKLVHA